LIRKLSQRLIHLSAQRLGIVRIQSPMFDVTNDSDNRLRFIVSLMNPFADGAPARKELVRKDIVNDNDHLSLFVIMVIKKPALLQRNSHSRQIRWFHR